MVNQDTRRKLLTAVRDAAGLTNEQVAEHIGLTKSTVAFYVARTGHTIGSDKMALLMQRLIEDGSIKARQKVLGMTFGAWLTQLTLQARAEAEHDANGEAQAG